MIYDIYIQKPTCFIILEKQDFLHASWRRVSQECHLKFNTPSSTPTTSWHNKDACLYTKKAKDGNLLIVILFKNDVLTCIPTKGEGGS